MPVHRSRKPPYRLKLPHRLAVLVAGLFVTLMPAPGGATDPDIQALIDEVTQARLSGFIQRLQDFQTRYSRTDSVIASANWLIKQHQSFGYTDIFEHPFVVTIGGTPYPQRNIVVTKPGLTRPNDIVIIGGHYDSTSNMPMTAAPGADDDGSGSAAVLVMAEILADVDLDATVMFAHWAAEEQGFVGSQAWVTFAQSEGFDIQVYMNLDACAYQGDPDNVVDLITNAQSMPFANQLRDMCNKYTTLNPIIVGPMNFSDHVPFQNAGIPYTYSIEDDITPHIHTPGDVLATLDMAYCREIVQANLAALVTFAGSTVTGVAEPSLAGIAPRATLDLAGVNPFTFRMGPATLDLRLPAPGVARVAIHDVAGRRLATLFDGRTGTGPMRLTWEGRDGRGAFVPAGVYLARLTAGTEEATVKLVVNP